MVYMPLSREAGTLSFVEYRGRGGNWVIEVVETSHIRLSVFFGVRYTSDSPQRVFLLLCLTRLTTQKPVSDAKSKTTKILMKITIKMSVEVVVVLVDVAGKLLVEDGLLSVPVRKAEENKNSIYPI